MRISVFIILVIFLTGCNARKPVVDSVTTTTLDSTYVKERIIPRDTLMLYLQIHYS